MGQMVGMDVAEVRALARRFVTTGERLPQIAKEIDGALARSTWVGQDASGFKQRWQTRRAYLDELGRTLTAIAETLRKEADDQERTSDSGGSIGGLAGGAAGALALLDDVAGALGDLWNTMVGWGSDAANDLLDTLGNLGDRAIDFLKWLSGPDSPSLSDLTALVPGLQDAIGNGADFLMNNPSMGAISNFITDKFGFTYVPEGDFYTTNENSFQSHFGFMDAYDRVHKLGGMDLDDKVMEFEVDGTEYRLELWRGEYLSGGGFGGEIGLYTRHPDAGGFQGFLQGLIPGYYSTAQGDDQIRMTQTIYNTETGQVYFTNDNKGSTDGDHYWNLAIQTSSGVPREQIGQVGTLYPTSPEMGDAMFQALEQEGLNPVRNSDGSVTYTWGR